MHCFSRLFGLLSFVSVHMHKNRIIDEDASPVPHTRGRYESFQRIQLPGHLFRPITKQLVIRHRCHVRAGLQTSQCPHRIAAEVLRHGQRIGRKFTNVFNRRSPHLPQPVSSCQLSTSASYRESGKGSDMLRGSYPCTVQARWTRFGQLGTPTCWGRRGGTQRCRSTQPCYPPGKYPAGPAKSGDLSLNKSTAHGILFCSAPLRTRM